MTKYTKWFPAEIKPVHKGVYQVFNNNSYAYWDGKNWAWTALSVASAATRRVTLGASQHKNWRGLTKKENT